MALTENDDLVGKLYGGHPTRENKKDVLELGQNFPEGPLQVVSIHNDTVLHIAACSTDDDFVCDLLHLLKCKFPQLQSKIAHRRNRVENTILHEAATSNRLVPAAKAMLSMAPDLLTMHNKSGETALFLAARYGQIKMFAFLDEEVNKKFRSQEAYDNFYWKQDKSSTILHTAITAEHFELGLWIASKYKYLIGEQDKDGMTALQLLACNSSAFKSRNMGFLKRFLLSRVGSGYTPLEVVLTGWTVPFWEALWKERRTYELVLTLAELLIKDDKSWKETNLAEGVEGNSGEPSSFLQENEIENPRKNSAGTPLFLATKSGCVDIVERILQLYPQAIEHIDGDGRTILHIAIEYRQMEIFNMVEKMEIPMKRLIKKTDKNLNSILHMVGRMAKDGVTKGMRRGPALQLQEDLLLFERINKISSKNFFKHINTDGLTAEDLFARKNKKLSSDAEEWLKRTAKSCSVVTVLIATIAFAAAYTVPGGSDNTGIPVLLNLPFFSIFTIGDVVSLAFTLLSIISFLPILTSSFRLEDFKQSLLRKLTLGITFLNLSVSMVMLAFAVTIILMMKNEKPWIRFVFYAIAFLPMVASVIFFEMSRWSLYSSLMKIFKYILKENQDGFTSVPRIPPPSDV